MCGCATPCVRVHVGAGTSHLSSMMCCACGSCVTNNLASIAFVCSLSLCSDGRACGRRHADSDADRHAASLQSPARTVAFTPRPTRPAVCMPCLVPCVHGAVRRERDHAGSCGIIIGLTCQMCGCRYWSTVERRLMRYISASNQHTRMLHSIPSHASPTRTHLHTKET